MLVRELLTETTAAPLRATHRTSARAAADIIQTGFRLDRFGTGAGSGPGEPAGVYLSPEGDDSFAREVRDRRLHHFDTTIPVRVHAANVLTWGDAERRAFVREQRLRHRMTRFNLSLEDAERVLAGNTRGRPDLEAAFRETTTAAYEADEAMALNRSLRALGYDAVRYQEPFRRVDQMIVLDPAIIEIEPSFLKSFNNWTDFDIAAFRFRKAVEGDAALQAQKGGLEFGAFQAAVLERHGRWLADLPPADRDEVVRWEWDAFLE